MADAAAPSLTAAPPRATAWREWIPVIAWGVVIFSLSSSAFSASNTAHYIDPVLRWLLPGVTAATIDIGHVLIRKTAHFTEYAVLFWLLIRGPMAQRPYSALLLCVLYALGDEGLQIFVPGRTASLYDVAIDSGGALFSRYLIAAITELA